ncbi:hypothetical protein SAMN05444411_102399 [Lutibacter oricola]|uniref:Anti-sigma-K factor rskA n=1 Tax=Lutibacter oricola TaxID=762486 RepID=A0A1H2X840_9FLAO|nr:anti-sigma factor [Lutibacter oricola]SDW89082.1 hypothetical protein SAMN05444411_102399 [Lutibacter oricola]
MTKIFKLLALFVLAFTVTFCSDDDEPTTKDLTLNISGLEDLGADYEYEGWLILADGPVTTGRFSVDGSGTLSQTNFTLNIETLAAAEKFVLTIEPKVGDDPAPSDVHILAGDFVGNSSALTIGHGAALGNDFSTASGKYILATPTDSDGTNEKSGVWFLDNSSGSPVAGLNLPTLPAGWKYEGWAVTGGTPLTSGTFTSVTGADEFNDFSGTMGSPPFPGEDFLRNAPSGITFPLDLSGGKAVISIEPDPDNSPAPFLLKPLVGDIPTDVMAHTVYTIGQNLNFPTGTASR